MEPYIRLNIELWKKATDDFEKDPYKLMINSVFGKTMENLRGRVDVKLVCTNDEDNPSVLSPAQPLLEPTCSTMTLQQSKCIRAV